jgi:hypothetical protein
VTMYDGNEREGSIPIRRVLAAMIAIGMYTGRSVEIPRLQKTQKIFNRRQSEVGSYRCTD